MAGDPFEDMTPYRGMQLISGALKRWGDTTVLREKSIDFMERTMNDEEVPAHIKLKIVECTIKIVAQEQTDERMAMIGGGNEVSQPQMVLLLPPNGTEKEDDDETDQDR